MDTNKCEYNKQRKISIYRLRHDVRMIEEMVERRQISRTGEIGATNAAPEWQVMAMHHTKMLLGIEWRNHVRVTTDKVAVL